MLWLMPADLVPGKDRHVLMDTHGRMSALQRGRRACPERSRRGQRGSGKCGNPLGCRCGRCSGNTVAGAVGVAESAETPLRPQAAPALIHVAALRTANAGPSPCLTGGEVATFGTVLPPCFPPRKKGSAISGQPLVFVGGAKRDRTVDLYNAIVALSQLSYGPEIVLAVRGIGPAPNPGNCA